jgi:DNA-binding response OmpR family regulator
MEVILTEQGFQVIKTASGNEAITEAKLKQPDLILLDVMMPGINGWQTLQQLKTEVQTHSIPVIMVSACGDDRQKAMDNGAAEYITKPFSTRYLIYYIELLLNIEEDLADMKWITIQ